MKNIIVSILLTLILCLSTIAVNAQDFPDVSNKSSDTANDNTVLFENKYLNWIKENNNNFVDNYFYYETYTHQDKNGKADWVLLYAGLYPRTDEICYFRAGNVIVYAPGAGDYFRYGYGIYDIQADKFLDLFDLGKDISGYNGLEDNLLKTKENRLIGDLNSDNQLTIKDATEIQLQLTQAEPVFDTFVIGQPTSPYEKSGFYADCNEDGKVNIRDATFIQKRLANRFS